MSEVSVNIHGRNYGISCDEGQEGRVQELASFVDAKVQDMAASGAATNDTQLLVLASILISDEVFELREQLETLRQANENNASSNGSNGSHAPIADEETVRKTIEALASRINGIADRLQNA